MNARQISLTHEDLIIKISKIYSLVNTIGFGTSIYLFSNQAQQHQGGFTNRPLQYEDKS